MEIHKASIHLLQCAKLSLYMQASNHLGVAIVAHQELPMASLDFAGAPAVVNPLCSYALLKFSILRLSFYV
jgi:hypothetical protein